LNAAVSKWFTEQQASGVVVTGPQILEKARVFGQIMDINFQVTFSENNLFLLWIAYHFQHPV
jgi:hypothetical protein